MVSNIVLGERKVMECTFVVFCCVGSECMQVCMHAGCDVVCFTIMMSDNGIGQEGAKALSPSLGQLKQLTVLGLAGE